MRVLRLASIAVAISGAFSVLCFGLAGKGAEVTSIVLDVSDGEAAASDFAWSPDSRNIAVISRLLRKVSVFDASSGRLVAHLENLPGGAASIDFDAHGNVVCGPVLAPNDGATVWDFRSGARHAVPGPSPSDSTFATNMLMEFSVDRTSNRLVGRHQTPKGSGEAFGLALYDLNDRRLLAASGPSALALSLAPGGRKAAFRAKNGALEIFDLASGRTAHSVAAHKGGVKATAWSPDGAMVASGGPARAMARNPQSGIVEVLQDPQTLKLWTAESGGFLGGAELPELVSSIAFSPDSRRIAASDGLGGVTVLDAHDLAHVLRHFPAPRPQTVVARFSPDGRSLGRLLTATSQIEISDATAGD